MAKYQAHRRVTLSLDGSGDRGFWIGGRRFELHDYTGPHKLRLVHEDPGMRQILVVTDQNWTTLPGGLKVMSDPGARDGEVVLVTSGLDAKPLMTDGEREADRRKGRA